MQAAVMEKISKMQGHKIWARCNVYWGMALKEKANSWGLFVRSWWPDMTEDWLKKRKKKVFFVEQKSTWKDKRSEFSIWTLSVYSDHVTELLMVYFNVHTSGGSDIYTAWFWWSS